MIYLRANDNDSLIFCGNDLSYIPNKFDLDTPFELFTFAEIQTFDVERKLRIEFDVLDEDEAKVE